jgi:Rrf2 family nitric oxide-sensitive transcriptional repressor
VDVSRRRRGGSGDGAPVVRWHRAGGNALKQPVAIASERMDEKQETHMRLTVFTDYTLRTLIYLALRPDTLVTIADIAEAYQISNNHLMKVVHQLSLSGDVVTVRGQRGGLRLARPANEINVGTVVRRSEADLEMMPCFGTQGACVIKPECVLANAVDEALRAFLATLDSYTLEDLVRPRLGLARLLQIGEPLEPEPA